MPPEMQPHHEDTAKQTASDTTEQSSPAADAPDRGWYIRRIIGSTLILVAGLLLAVVLVPLVQPEVELTLPSSDEPPAAPPSDLGADLSSDLENLQNLPEIPAADAELSTASPTDPIAALEELRTQESPPAAAPPNTSAGNDLSTLSAQPEIPVDEE